MVELLASYGVDPELVDRRGQSAMFYLAKTRHLDCFAVLRRLGGNVDREDATGQTPLFYAASTGSVDMVRALFEAGADTSHKDRHGQTPLYYAATREVFVAMLNCGADLHVRDFLGRSVMDLANSGLLKREVFEFTRTMSTMERVRGRLSWCHCEDGSVYAVLLANRCDASELCSLENEFVEDHKSMLGPMLPGASEEDLYKEVGLNSDPQRRRAIIQSITSTQRLAEHSPRQGCTLKCLHYPRGRDSELPQIVGYVYFKLRDDENVSTGANGSTPPTMVFSHLKVSRRHQGRGCATLLMAGALKYIESSADAARFGVSSPEVWSRHAQLSVVEQNGPARALYTKLGFRETLRHHVRQGSPVVWITMTYRAREGPGAIAVRWLSMVPVPGGGCCSIRPSQKVTDAPEGLTIAPGLHARVSHALLEKVALEPPSVTPKRKALPASSTAAIPKVAGKLVPKQKASPSLRPALPTTRRRAREEDVSTLDAPITRRTRRTAPLSSFLSPMG